MAAAHGNPSITSTLVGSVPTNPDRPLEPVYIVVCGQNVQIGWVYADETDDIAVQAYLAQESKKATRTKKQK